MTDIDRRKMKDDIFMKNSKFWFWSIRNSGPTPYICDHNYIFSIRTGGHALSDDSWTTIEERKSIKHDINSAKSVRLKDHNSEEYREADMNVKRAIRKDKRLYIDNLASEAEEAAKESASSHG